VEGALWTPAMIAAAQAGRSRPEPVVVAVDPPVTGTKASDECGIVVVGADDRGPAAHLAGGGAGGCTVRARRRWLGAGGPGGDGGIRAERLVVEVNQGGDLVAAVVRQIDPLVPIREVRATRARRLRAEPVAALYEQGRVGHVPRAGALEAQMAQMTHTGWQGQGSPDRLDALVWALTELMVEPGRIGRPGVRMI
jgi:phage terminase large subunit-like protein